MNKERERNSNNYENVQLLLLSKFESIYLQQDEGILVFSLKEYKQSFVLVIQPYKTRKKKKKKKEDTNK